MKGLFVPMALAMALTACAPAQADAVRPRAPTEGAAPLAHPIARSMPDPRLLSVPYALDQVVRVPTRRGQVTHLVLPDDERLQGGIATGQGADCTDPHHSWCVTAASDRDVFVKPRAGATRNTLALVSDRRRHSFELVLAAEDEPAALRVTVLPPESPVRLQPLQAAMHVPRTVTQPPDIVAERLRQSPAIVNTEYSVATGAGSDDIVPRLVFDDGHRTHFRFAPGLALPAVFEQGPGLDEPEQMVNVQVEGDRIVTDRVARRFVLRLGTAVVSVANERFEPGGPSRSDGSLVTGVRRALVDPRPRPMPVEPGRHDR